MTVETEVILAYGENAFTVMGVVTKALRDAGEKQDVREAFMAEAMAGDYETLNRVCREWARRLDEDKVGLTNLETICQREAPRFGGDLSRTPTPVLTTLLLMRPPAGSESHHRLLGWQQYLAGAVLRERLP